MAIVSLWSNPQLSDSDANVKFINETEEGYFVEHSECGEVFELDFKTSIHGCPHCQGDLILPREDW